jgi:hypothetical protein
VDTTEEVVVVFGFGINGILLEGTILHNLPAQAGKVVSCREQYKTLILKRSVWCTGVGPLKATKSYFLKIKL